MLIPAAEKCRSNCRSKFLVLRHGQLYRPVKGHCARPKPRCAQSVAGATTSHPGDTMRIRQLARNAALATVAAIVTAGFSAGVAQATNAAPASTVSVVTHGGSITPRMLPGCTPQPAFCTYASSIRGIILLQKIGCARGHGAHAVNGDVIFQLFNGCGTRVYYYWNNMNSHGCINQHSTSSRAGGFPNITFFYVDTVPNC